MLPLYDTMNERLTPYFSANPSGDIEHCRQVMALCEPSRCPQFQSLSISFIFLSPFHRYAPVHPFCSVCREMLRCPPTIKRPRFLCVLLPFFGPGVFSALSLVRFVFSSTGERARRPAARPHRAAISALRQYSLSLPHAESLTGLAVRAQSSAKNGSVFL